MRLNGSPDAKEDHLKSFKRINTGMHLHNVLDPYLRDGIVEDVSPGLVERSTIVDIEIRFGVSNEDREAVILSMFMAGYKLRNDQLSTLTFQKEPE